MRSFAIVLLLSVFGLLPVFVFANTAPVANPGGPYLSVTQKPILFDGSASSDADGDLLEYSWDFGDGATGVGDTLSHAYAVPGVFTVSLTVNDGTVDSAPTTTTATISLKPPQVPTPASGAPFISFPLQLDWEDVPEAQSYRYELIGYEEDGEPKEFPGIQSQSDPPSPTVLKFLEPQKSASEYQKECAGLDGDPDTVCNDGEFRIFVKNKQKRLWHAKSCKDAEGTQCGPWGEVWDFTYLLGPAVLQTPSNNALDVAIPVTLDWEDMPGAKSYELITAPCPPWGVQDPNTDCYSLPVSPHNEALVSEYADTLAECLFTRQSEYGWQVASCLDTQAAFCTHPADIPAWYFITGSLDHDGSPIFLSAPILLGPSIEGGAPPEDPADPSNIPSISQSDMLRWSGDSCAYFNRINIFNETGTRITEDNCSLPGSACTEEIGDESFVLGGIGNLWGQLDKTYSWSVTPCWGLGSTHDCTDAADSERWYFHTSGKAPTLINPTNNSSTKIPIILSWQGDGASYSYQVAKDEAFAQIAKEDVAQGTSVEIMYAPPDITTGTSYWWHVKTCVDEDGAICGPWSTTSQFTTFPLNAPTAPNNPSNGSTTPFPKSLSWAPDPGANYYTYQVQYASLGAGETLEGCDTKAGGWLIPPQKVGRPPIASQSSFYFSEQCLGEYRWQVASCLDKECLVQEPANLDTAPTWTFTAVEQAASGQGLVPCGRTANDPLTPYNERETCQLKHAGFLLQNLLDFILWRVSLFVLLVLAVITGATSYFSLGGPNALARIKTTFRSFLVGFLVLMFGWMLVNIVLMLFGFQFEFFGRWWEISF